MDVERALVTGAEGMLGRALVDELRSRRVEVVALSRRTVDLRETRAVEDAVTQAAPDVVFHLAAKVAGLGGNVADPYGMFFDNLRINANVVDACRRAKVERIVAAGTTATYSDDISLPMREADIWQGPPHGSERPYGQAKRAMLAQLEALQASDGTLFSFAILTNLYGPHDRFDLKHGHVVPSLLLKFFLANRNGSNVEVWGSGRPTRDFVYAPDAARALILLAERPAGAVNVATGTSVTIAELVAEVARVSGFKGEVVWNRSGPDGQLRRAYDTSILKELGFTFDTSLARGLELTYAWITENESTLRH